jgi:hypothetical protein
MYYPYFQQQQQQPAGTIIWVQGEAGAKSYMVGAGQSILLMDSENPYFYIKSADQSGMPILRKFKFEEMVAEQKVEPDVVQPDFITREEFEKRIAELTSNRRNNNRRDKTDGKPNS